MKSMTGFGYAESQTGRFSVSVEIKSFNNRYLDLVLNMPPSLNPVEDRIRESVRKRVLRGRVECHIRFRDLQENLQASLDTANVRTYIGVLEELRAVAGIVEPVGLSHLLSMEGLVRTERQRDPDLYWQGLQPVLESAALALEDSRRREGVAILTDLLSQLDRIEKGVRSIQALSPRMEEQIRASLRQRFQELLGDLVEEQRMLAEVAVQLMRFSINEEIVRLHAHLATARSLMHGDESTGKKLDFLFQEMNREINTIGSKNIMIEISNAVIEVKDALENIREQIRNVE